VELPQWSIQVRAQYSMVMIPDAPSESEAHCRSPREDIFTFILGNDARNFSTRSHLLITGEVSLVPISVWGGCWFKCGWLMAKTQQHEDVQHIIG